MNREDKGVLLSASLLSADFARLGEVVTHIASGVDLIHCDVMDGHFVPNLTFGPLIVKTIKRVSPVPLDVHLMIEKPGDWVKRYLDCGLDDRDYLTFHLEAEEDPKSGLETIRGAGVKAGLAIKPATAFDRVIPYVPLINILLIMTVEPGFGGQKFMEDMLIKVENARAVLPPEIVIAVDGGIDRYTAPRAVRAGAKLLVVGNALFSQPDPLREAKLIRDAAELECSVPESYYGS